MKETRAIMGMPITVAVADASATQGTLAEIFAYFEHVDAKFSTYKNDSEISKINRNEIVEANYTPEMQEVLSLAEETRVATKGYFDIHTPRGTMDPSGLVKGWAIQNAAALLTGHAFEDFYIEAGGDIQTSGRSEQKGPWRVGIRSPFEKETIVKVVYLSRHGIATSGTYIRGDHIYNPHTGKEPDADIASISIVAKDVYEADRFATAAYAMGRAGIDFIESIKGLEGYMIDRKGTATMTSGFEAYTILNA